MLKGALAGLVLLAGIGTAAAQTPAAGPQWVEGENYFAIANPQPTQHPDKVVVTEVFSFGCPACNSFQPFANKLESELPKGAVMEHVPASFIPTENWPTFQRAYFTAKALGADNMQSRNAMFKAIWGPDGPLATYDMATQRPKSADNMPTIADIAKVYAPFGAKPGQFVATADSFAVNLAMKRADKQIVAWGVTGTPTIVVDGKWRMDTRSAGGPQQLVDLALYLANKELAARQGK